MKYQIKIDSIAKRALKKLPKKEYIVIQQDIDALSQEPRPYGVKKLINNKDELYRIKSGVNGDYRILYSIKDKELLIVIVKLGMRKEIYRDI